jgi:hypothetical protein
MSTMAPRSSLPFLARNVGILVPFLVFGAAGAADAQQTIDACYVPDVGAIYLIGLPGLPTECLSPTHEPISWTGGGALADGSVTAVKLADGAVITVKLADGAVTTAKLAFDPATQAELDTHTGSGDHDGRYFTQTELSSAGTINTAANPVDWSRLKGVPADFADGVDDGGGIASDIDCAGCVGSPDIATGAVTAAEIATDAVTAAEIADGAVTAAEIATGAIASAEIADGSVAAADLAFDPATQTELDTHAGSADHDGRYFTETELNSAGAINTTTNPVDWTRLKNVPADFADGVDDGGGIASDIDCAGCVGTPDIAAGAVTAAEIATGAVGSAEIADGDIAVADLAFDPATQTELDTHAGSADHDGRYFTETELSSAGTINTLTNPVDWTQLKNVPADFADGSDDVGGTASDLACAGCVGSADIAAGAVTSAEIATDAVTATEIATGAVGSAEIADNAVAIGDLAFNPATQGELDTHAGSADHDGRYYTETELNSAGTINTGTNPVDWTRLKNVPADFADGVDDVGGTATDLACAGCVGSADIAAGAVTASEIATGAVGPAEIATGAVGSAEIADNAVAIADLAFDPATQGELDTHAGSADHDGRYYTETELNSAGTINTGSNPVDWTRLKNVPADFADGVDDGTGTVTSVGTGAGLTGGPITTSGTISVDLAGPGAATTVARSDHDHSLTDNTNTAIGEQALLAPSSGGNTGVGRSALAANAAGASNTAVGANAMQSNLGGSTNTGLGANALSNNTSGGGNTAVGYNALLANAGGTSNTAVGSRALDSSTGGGNTGVGVDAIGANTTGQFNTAVGLGALQNADGGDSNIAIGYLAGNSVTAGSNNIHIGTAGPGNESAVIRIGDGQTETYVAGISGATAPSGVTVLVGTGGQLGTVVSSIRFKEDVADLGRVSRRLLDLRPVQFHYRPEYDDGGRLIQYGLIAEEVERVFPELVIYGPDGRVQAVRYHLLSVLLLNELQRQDAELAELRELRDEVDTLAAELADLRRAVADAGRRD